MRFLDQGRWGCAAGAAIGMLLLASCHPSAPTPSLGPPPISIPRGCEQNLAGHWTHALDPHFHYEAQDDGHTLLLLVSAESTPALLQPTSKASPADAGLVVKADAGADAGADGRADAGVSAPKPLRVVFARTPRGFTGEVQAEVSLPDKTCQVAFPAEVLGCSPQELVLRVTPSRSVDSECAISPAPPAPWTEHRLKRDR